MTRFFSTRLKFFLLLAISSLYTGAVNAVPAIWEAQLGATVTSTGGTAALDNTDDGTTGTDLNFGTMSFPFNGTIYTGTASIDETHILNISSNGFISLGGDNGDGCIPIDDCEGDVTTLTGSTYPIIAPFWTDLDPEEEGGDVFINRVDDDADPDIDRIVITFVTGYDDCTDEECSVQAQVQLLEDGTIIFGYNGIDLVNAGDTADDDVLIGLSPSDGATDPTGKDLSAELPSFDTGTEPTVYQLFMAMSAPMFDLDDTNVIFTPNGMLGYTVTDSIGSPPPSTEPPTWETRLGTTLDGQALDDTDDASIDLVFDTMSFPFAGKTYTGTASIDETHILNISSNGFISLGGDNGDGCASPSDCEGDVSILTGSTYPVIAPFWTDLDPGEEGGDIFINRFDDDIDPEIDRIVITFATGYNDCDAGECHVLAQVQLLESGKIIFGYNGFNLKNAANDADDDVLVGISPGGGATDPGSKDLSAEAPFDSITEDTIYQLFEAASAPPVDLDGGNIIFTPNGAGGFDVTAPGVSGAAVGGGIPGRNSNEGHCSLGREGAAFDPTLWLLVLVSLIYLGFRRNNRPGENRS